MNDRLQGRKGEKSLRLREPFSARAALLNFRSRAFRMGFSGVNNQTHRAEFLAAQLAPLRMQVAHRGSTIGTLGGCLEAARLAFCIANVPA